MLDRPVPTPPRARAPAHTARPFDILLIARELPGPNAPARVLAAAGYLVHPARNAAEAHRAVDQNARIGIALFELQNDGVRGLELYAALRAAIAPDRALAAIFLARSPAVNDVVRALRLEAVDLLRNPVDPAHLLDAVARAETILARRTALRQGAIQMSALAGALRTQALAIAETIELPPADAPTRHAEGRVEFTETLEAHAQREDTSSLAYTQRQRRRVLAAIKAQTLRRAALGAALAEDPCWDMLLDVYEKSLMGRPVSVSNLCTVAGVPATTALRRLDEMVAAGLIRRVRDAADARRVLVQLTDDGTQRLRSYFDAVTPDPC